MSPRSFDRFMVDVEIGRNLKLSRLSAAEFKAHLAGVLPIAAKAPVRGCLLVGHAPAEAQDVAWQAGVTVSVAQSTLRKLRDLGVLYRDSEMECERVHDWEQFNPEPKRDGTAAERAKRYRERHKDRDANGAVTPASHRDDRDANASVTPPEVEGEVEDPLKPPGSGGRSSSSKQSKAIEKAEAEGFAEWLLDHSVTTGRTAPAAGTKAYAALASMFSACRAEGHDLGALKLATRAAHASDFRRANGYDKAESVLRVTKVHDLIEDGRRAGRGVERQADLTAKLVGS